MDKQAGKGQSVVEFALIIPIILLLVMGTIELGRIFYIKIALQNAAREGAYYISYYPTDTAGTITVATKEAESMGVHITAGDVEISNCCTSGYYVQVRVKQDNVPLFIFEFLLPNLNLSSTVRMMVQ